MKRILVALMALCLASEVHAATYFLRSGGNDANVGTTNSDGGAWKTLAKANASVAPGDVVQVVSLSAADTTGGTATTIIAPAVDGTPSAWITYIGNPASPLTLGQSQILFQRQYLSIKGFRSRAGMKFDYVDETHKPYYDSLSYCHGQNVYFLMAKRCAVYHCTWRNTTGSYTTFFASQNSIAGPPAVNSTALGDASDNTIRDCQVNGGNISATPGQSKFFYMRWTHRDTIERNTFTATFTGTNPDCAGRYIYNSTGLQFNNNKWTFEAANEPAGAEDVAWVAYALRDSTQNVFFQTDTMLCGVSSGYKIGGRIINAGAFGGVTCWNLHWLGCRYLQTKRMFGQEAADSCVFVSTTIRTSRDKALEVYNGSNLLINHCTLFGQNSSKYGSGLTMGFLVNPAMQGCTITNNIFATDSMGYWYTYETALAFYNTYSHFNLINQNLYWSPKVVGGVTAYQHAASAPGNNFAVGKTSAWCVDGHDCQSAWGDPVFTDSSFATFNGGLGTNSIAVGQNFGADGYAGAILPTDNIPPAEAPLWTDAAGGTSTRVDFSVRWTDTGDDYMSGRATLVELALVDQSTADLTPATFNTYRVLTTIPLSPGTLRFVTLSASHAPGVLPDYWLGIRVTDKAGNVAYTVVQP